MARAVSCGRAPWWRPEVQDESGFDPTASGAWRGFYVYAAGGQRHAMQLDLVFGATTVRGTGADDVGRFTIQGGFEPDGVRVWWHKQYAGAHAVWYEGVRDGAQPRLVYGGWRLPPFDAGGFKIWRGSQDDSLLTASALDSSELTREALAREVLAR